MLPDLGYTQLLLLIAPVFLLVALGALVRRLGWMAPQADSSFVSLGVNVFFPCLIFSSVCGSSALNNTANIFWPPLIGFATTTLGFGVAWIAGRAIGLEKGGGLRTFAFAVGLYNYAYLSIPLVAKLFGDSALAVLFVHNVGVDFAVWTVGALLLSGGSLAESWRKILNFPVISLVLAVLVNALGWAPHIPEVLRETMVVLGRCAVPMGLFVIGALMSEHLAKPRELLNVRVVSTGLLLRLGLLPILFLVAARYLSISTELKLIMVVQASMPAGVFSIVLSRHYLGHPLTAAQIVLSTTIVSLGLQPLWLRFGLWWVGEN